MPPPFSQLWGCIVQYHDWWMLYNRGTGPSPTRLKAGLNRAQGEVEEIIHAIYFQKFQTMCPQRVQISYRAFAIYVSEREYGKLLAYALPACYLGLRHAIPPSSLSLGLKGLLKHHTDVCCCTYLFLVGSMCKRMHHWPSCNNNITSWHQCMFLPLLHIRAI